MKNVGAWKGGQYSKRIGDSQKKYVCGVFGYSHGRPVAFMSQAFLSDDSLSKNLYRMRCRGRTKNDATVVVPFSSCSLEWVILTYCFSARGVSERRSQRSVKRQSASSEISWKENKTKWILWYRFVVVTFSFPNRSPSHSSSFLSLYLCVCYFRQLIVRCSWRNVTKISKTAMTLDLFPNKDPFLLCMCVCNNKSRKEMILEITPFCVPQLISEFYEITYSINALLILKTPQCFIRWLC